MMKKSILALLLAVLASGAFAAPTTADDAAAVVAGWRGENRDGFGSLGAVVSVTSERDATGKLLWHVVKTANGAVVVAPDDEIGPVIATLPGSDGTINPKSPLYALLVRDMNVRLHNVSVTRQAQGPRLMAVSSAATPMTRPAALAAECEKAAAAWKRLTRTGPVLMAPMTVKKPATIYRWLDGWNGNTAVTSLKFWNQNGSPRYITTDMVFNKYTPEHYPCGCVATAGSAVMQYFNSTTGPKSGKTGTVSVDGEEKTQRCKGGPYDWSILPKFTDGGKAVSLNDAQLDLLAKVPYDLGTMIQMSYAADGSGTITRLLQQALVSYFGFKSAVYVPAQADTYANKGEDTVKLIYNQIRGGAPVLFGISGEAGGHEVVGAGYGEDADGTQRCYVFMGWGGTDDAWYALPAIMGTLDANGNATDEGFNVLDEIVTMLSTDGKSVPVVGEVVTSDGERYTADMQEGVDLEVELPDGQLVKVDENGFWGGRIAPGAGKFEVFLTNGSDAVEFEVGSMTATGTGDGAAMAAATPAALTIVYDGGFLTAYSKFDKAWVKALKEGKQILVFAGVKSGDDWATIKEALKELADPERGGAEGFNDRYVVYISDTDAANGGNADMFLGDGAVSYALVDPRLVTQPTFADAPEAAFYLTNSFPAGVTIDEVKARLPDELDAGLEAWEAEDRAPSAGEITGPHTADTGKYTGHKDPEYALTLTFADGVTLALDNRYPETWRTDGWTDDRVGGEFREGGVQGRLKIIDNPGGSDEPAEGFVGVGLDIWNGSYDYGDYYVKVFYKQAEIVVYRETVDGSVSSESYWTWPSQPVSIDVVPSITNWLDRAHKKGEWIRHCVGYEGTGIVGSGTITQADRWLKVQGVEDALTEITFLYEDYAWWVVATSPSDFSHADLDINTGWYTNNQEVTVHGTIAHTNTWIIWSGLKDFATETTETTCTFTVTAPIELRAIATFEVDSSEAQVLEPDAVREDGTWYFDKSLNEALPPGYVVVSQVVTDANQNKVIHYAVTQGEYPDDPEPDPDDPEINVGRRVVNHFPTIAGTAGQALVKPDGDPYFDVDLFDFYSAEEWVGEPMSAEFSLTNVSGETATWLDPGSFSSTLVDPTNWEETSWYQSGGSYIGPFSPLRATPSEPGTYVLTITFLWDDGYAEAIQSVITVGEPVDPPDPPEPPDPELVQPVITGIEVLADGSLLISVGEVRTGLTYTILAATEPGGEYAPLAETTVKATQDGTLEFTVPKDGAKQFYKARAAIVTEP